MSPKEKAEELFYKYRNIEFGKMGNVFYMISATDTKKCALMAVNEILGFIEDDRDRFSWKTYYKEVKKEIQKL